MNREVHVRFWEGVGVQFPRATRLLPCLRLGCPGTARLTAISDLLVHTRTLRSRKALAMTETELRLIAAPAMIGLSSKPKCG